MFGTIRFAWSRPYPLDDDERAVIVTVAGYVAQALERARHLSERLSAAETLQRALLSDLPDAAPYRLAARYRPARQGDSVGGDWYDAVSVPGDGLVLVIGDVTGHDMAAAGRMGQLRSMLRAFLVDRREPPSAALSRLDAARETLSQEVLLTALVAMVGTDGAGGHEVTWSNAGHLPPVLLHAGGRVEELAGDGLMLGVHPGLPRADQTHPLPAGSTLLLFTDGLVETRTASVTEGVQRLRDALGGLGAAPLEEILDTVLVRLPAVDHEDDIAVLALRVP